MAAAFRSWSPIVPFSTPLSDPSAPADGNNRSHILWISGFLMGCGVLSWVDQSITLIGSAFIEVSRELSGAGGFVSLISRLF